MIRTISANYLAQIYSALLNVILMPVFIKYMGAEAVGLIGFSLTLTIFFSLIDSFFSQNLIRELALYKKFENNSVTGDLIRTIEIISFFFVILVFFLFFIFAHWFSTAWFKIVETDIDSVIISIKLIGILIGLRYFEGLYRNCLVGLNKIVLLSNILIVSATLRALGSILILIFYSSDIGVYFIWQISVAVITIIPLFIITINNTGGGKISRKFALNTIRKDKSFSLGMFFHTLLVVTLTQGDKILLSKLLTLTEFGYYSIAASIAGVVLMLVTPVTQTIFGRLVLKIENGLLKELAAIYHFGCQFVTVVSGSFSIIVIFYSKSILNFWLGPESVTENLPNLVAILVAANFIGGALWMPNILQFAYKYTKLTIISNIIAILFYFSLILFVVPEFGSIGAGILLFAINFGLLLIGIYFFMYKKFLQLERNKWLFTDLFLIVIAQSLLVYLSKFIYFDSFFQMVFLSLLFLITFFISFITAPDLRKLLVTKLKEL